jgi:hypothetical protein
MLVLLTHRHSPLPTVPASSTGNLHGPLGFSLGGRVAFGWVVAPAVRLPASRCQGVATYQNGPNHISHGSRKAPGIALAESGAVAAFRAFNRPAHQLRMDLRLQGHPCAVGAITPFSGRVSTMYRDETVAGMGIRCTRRDIRHTPAVGVKWKAARPERAWHQLEQHPQTHRQPRQVRSLKATDRRHTA